MTDYSKGPVRGAICVLHLNFKAWSQGAEEFARSFASSFTLRTATHIDVRAIPLSVWRRIAGKRR